MLLHGSEQHGFLVLLYDLQNGGWLAGPAQIHAYHGAAGEASVVTLCDLLANLAL